MPKYDVGFNTETFRHYIVEAESAEEAMIKGWDAFSSGDDGESLEDGITECTGAMDIGIGKMVFPAPGACRCGHRLDEHRQTMPGHVLCMGCLTEPDNRSVIGCESFILANAEAI